MRSGILSRVLQICGAKYNRKSLHYSKMSKNAILIQKFNPGNGKLEWDLQEEDYDYTQEIARSGFADMLHDEERNLKYNLALQKAINCQKTNGEPTRVLDIGTGTGLLAMMAAKSGSSLITACETFQPMATCARKVITHNGCNEKIKLIPKRSTDISVGPGKDMELKANILVTEVFDTELIGEGAIGTFNHAHTNLLTEDSIVIPARATIFIQLIESELVSSWNRSKPIHIGNHIIIPPSKVESCPGNGAVNDLQLAQLDPLKFKVLSNPIPFFHFDWNSKDPIPNDDQKTVQIISTSSGKIDGVLMWWTLDMDREGEILLSCAPPWAHPEGKNLPWRDHWMQAIYYLPTDVHIKSEGEKLHLTGFHDEYSLWFGLKTDSSTTNQFPRPFCDCSVHLAVSRTRLGQLNDQLRNFKYFQALEKVVDSNTVCLTLGDCCLLGLMAAKLGARRVYAVERNPHCRRVLEAWVKENDLDQQVFVLEGDFQKNKFDSKVNLVLGEPVFDSSVLPWHNLYFSRWIKDILQEGLLADGVTKILPGKAHVYAIAIEMKDLWKIRAPVHKTQEIDLSIFDKLIDDAINVSDSQIEPHPLWEYPTRALGPVTHLMVVDLTTLSEGKDKSSQVKGKLDLPAADGSLNGVALWIDWQLDEDVTISGGPTAPVTLGQNVQWDVHSKQAVYFMKNPVHLSNRVDKVLNYEVGFNVETYEMKVAFSVE